MSKDDTWKEHLGFTSGTILVFGFVLINFYSFASHIQLSDGLALVTNDGRAVPEMTLFSLTTLSVALGSSILLLSAIHIGCRGFWLAATSRADSETKVSDQLARICNNTFVSIFSITATFLFGFLPMYPLLLAITLIQRGAAHLLSIQSRTAGAVLYMCAFLAVLIPVGFLTPRATKGGWNWSPHHIGRFMGTFSSFGALLSFVVFANIFFWFTYTAELQVDKGIIYRSTNDKLEVSLVLGGATSESKKVRLDLVNDVGVAVQRMTLQELDKGRYVAYLSAVSLAPGRYHLSLTYPRFVFKSEYPFAATEVRVARRFLVVE